MTDSNNDEFALRRSFVATGAAGAAALLLGAGAEAAAASGSTAATRVVAEFLQNTAPDKIEAAANRLVAEDATYISLNFDDPELKKILPWTGTQKGRQAFVTTFVGVAKYWTVEEFKVFDLFGTDENVAVFGSFTYRSNTRGKSFTSPFSIHAKVKGGRIVYFLFMEDTFASSRSFRSTGTWSIKTEANGPEIQI
nr:nuclear transport factor 2 family protein [uncultured Roseateles sp.]